MIKTIFTLVFRKPSTEISFQLQKTIQMPYRVHEDEAFEYGPKHDTRFLDPATVFFNLFDECLHVILEPSEGDDWHFEHISEEDIPLIRAELLADGWAAA